METLNIETLSDQIRFYTSRFSFVIAKQDRGLFFSHSNGELSLNSCTSAVLINIGNKIIPCTPVLPEKQDISFFLEDFNDQFGSGKKIKLKCLFRVLSRKNNPIIPDIPATWIFHFYLEHRTEINLISNPSFLSVQIILDFIPTDIENFQLFGYAPLYCKNHGVLRLKTPYSKQIAENITFYSNGWQSWSNSYLLTYFDKWPSSPVKMGRINMENQNQELSGRYQSEWHTAISEVTTEASLVLGFVTLKDQFSRILMNRLEERDQISWLCAYSQTDSIPMKKLNKGLRKSEMLMISLVSKPEAYEVLTDICRFGGILAKKTPSPEKILTGWCSWYYYYTKVCENDIISNLEFFKNHPDLPLDLVQLDDGYQTAIGDWGTSTEKFNSKFPHGLKWLVDKIHIAKFLAGIWVAPFFITRKSESFAQHSEWILNNDKGKKITTAFNWGASQYAIDLSRDEVMDYLSKYMRTISEDWGFDFLKIDFLYASEVLGAQYRNPTFSRAQILRRGIEAIRDGFGDNKMILGCGCPLGPAVGLVDQMRIGTDTAAKWSPNEYLVYQLGKVSMPSLKAALRSTIQRTYMHNTWWVNDPDCVVVRKNRSQLTMAEIQLQLTVFGLSGGQVLISDDEKLVSQERMDMLKKIIPPYSHSINSDSKEHGKNNNGILRELIPEAIPLDLFLNPLPNLYAKTIQTPFGIRHLIALINWKNRRGNFTYTIDDFLPYNYVKHYSVDHEFLIFDYWEERVIGRYSKNKKIVISHIPPHGCRYWGIIPIFPSENTLLFLASTLHICQGAYELKSKQIKKDKISLDLAIPGARAGDLYFWSPNPLSISSITHRVTQKSIPEGILVKVHVYIEESTTVTLNISKNKEK